MFKRILVPTDFSPSSNSVFPCAITLAQAFGGKLYLLHVMPPSSVREPERLGDFPPLEPFAHTGLENGFQPPLQAELPTTRLYLYDTSVSRMIADVAAERAMDLICMAVTSQRPDLTWWSAGKTTEQVIERAACSVLCLRGQPIKEKEWKRPTFRNLLLLTDLSTQAEAVIERIVPFLQRFNSLLHLFPIQRGFRPHNAEQTELQAFCHRRGIQTNFLAFPEPTQRMQNLLQFLDQQPVGLVVMTPRMRARFSNRFVSDVLVQLLRKAKCPVLLLR